MGVTRSVRGTTATSRHVPIRKRFVLSIEQVFWGGWGGGDWGFGTLSPYILESAR